MLIRTLLSLNLFTAATNMATLAENSAARGAARAAGVPIVNAAPAPAPVATPRAAPIAPTVNLSTRTYSGAPPPTAVSSAAKASGVDVANRYSITPTSGQTAARASIAAEQARRQGNMDLEKTRDAKVAELNAAATAAGEEANYTVVGVPGGGTKIIKQSGYDPEKGAYTKSEDVAGAVFTAKKPTGTPTYGVSSGPKSTISDADAKIKSLKDQIANPGRNYGEDDYSVNQRVANMNAELNNLLQEKQGATDAAIHTQETEESLTPDVLALVKSAAKMKTGRIQADTGIDPITAAPDDIQKIFQQHPEMAQVYEPLVEALARDDKMQARALFGTLSRLDKQGERAARVAEDAIAASKEYHNKLAEQSEASYNTQLDIAAENKAQAEFEKAQYEHKQAFVISQKMDEAADNELINRRAAAAMGYTSDTNGLMSMQKEARKAQDVISFMQSETNMVTAEMGRRITSTYSLAVRDLSEKYDATLLQLDHNLSASLGEIQSTLNLGDEERAKAYESAYQGYLNKVSANDIKTAEIYGSVVSKLNDQAFEMKKIKLQEEATDKRMTWQEEMADKRMRFQESQNDKRLAFQEDNANRRFELELGKAETAANRQRMQDEKKEAEGIRTDIRNIKNSDTVKTYKQIRDFSKQATAYLEDALASKDKLKLGAAKEAIGYMRAKGLDPMTGVRDGDYARLGKDQGWIDKFSNAMNAIDGGDLTGLSTDLVKVFTEGLELSAQTYRDSAMGEYTPAINRLVEFNNSSEFLKLDPRTVLDTDFVDETLLQSYFQSNNSSGYNYDYGSYSGNPGSSEPSDSAVVDPLATSLSTTGMSMDEILGDFSGLQMLRTPQAQAFINASGTESVGDVFAKLVPVTQGFGTPISEANYSKSTVKAWGGKHQGIDVAMPWGSFVPSISGGTLLSVEFNKGGYGLSAIVKAPDGAEIRYSHLLAIDPRMKIGQEILKGQEFAQVGNTGNVFSSSGGDGTHLDLRIRKGGKYIDPYSYYS